MAKSAKIGALRLLLQFSYKTKLFIFPQKGNKFNYFLQICKKLFPNLKKYVKIMRTLFSFYERKEFSQCQS